MEQYIDKAAVVAKIKRLQDAHKDQLFRNLFTEEFIGGIEAACDQILFYINTLEVKEVDLLREFDIENAVHGTVDYPFIGHDFPNIYPNYKELKEYCERKGIKDNDKVKLIIIKDM